MLPTSDTFTHYRSSSRYGSPHDWKVPSMINKSIKESVMDIEEKKTLYTVGTLDQTKDYQIWHHRRKGFQDPVL